MIFYCGRQHYQRSKQGDYYTIKLLIIAYLIASNIMQSVTVMIYALLHNDFWLLKAVKCQKRITPATIVQLLDIHYPSTIREHHYILSA